MMRGKPLEGEMGPVIVVIHSWAADIMGSSWWPLAKIVHLSLPNPNRLWAFVAVPQSTAAIVPGAVGMLSLWPLCMLFRQRGKTPSRLDNCQPPAVILFLQCFESDQNMVIRPLVKITTWACVKSQSPRRWCITEDTWQWAPIFLICFLDGISLSYFMWPVAALKGTF